MCSISGKSHKPAGSGTFPVSDLWFNFEIRVRVKKKGKITSHVLYFDSYTCCYMVCFFPKVEPGTEILTKKSRQMLRVQTQPKCLCLLIGPHHFPSLTSSRLHDLVPSSTSQQRYDVTAHVTWRPRLLFAPPTSCGVIVKTKATRL